MIKTVMHFCDNRTHTVVHDSEELAFQFVGDSMRTGIYVGDDSSHMTFYPTHSIVKIELLPATPQDKIFPRTLPDSLYVRPSAN